MSRLLLASDDYIYKRNGLYYAQSPSMYEMYQRYLRVFDQIRIVSRCINESPLSEKRVLMDDDRIEVFELPLTQGIYQYATHLMSNRKKLKNVGDSCDAIIYRLPATVSFDVYSVLKKASIPYATEVVNDELASIVSAENLLLKLAFIYTDYKMRQICYKADGVSCVTQYQLQKRYFSKKSHHFTSYYSSLALTKDFYSNAKEYPDANQFSIAHVALQVQVGGKKGHKELIECVKVLKEKGYNVLVKFAGKDYFGGVGQLQQIASDLGVKDNVQFVGMLDKNELNNLLEKSDLFVLPTKAEGLPRVIIEAMAKGLPCVTTNVSGNPELVEPQYLVDNYSDVNGMAERIINLINSKEEYERCSKRNFEKSKEYEASILQERRDIFYKQLLDITK